MYISLLVVWCVLFWFATWIKMLQKEVDEKDAQWYNLDAVLQQQAAETSKIEAELRTYKLCCVDDELVAKYCHVN